MNTVFRRGARTAGAAALVILYICSARVQAQAVDPDDNQVTPRAWSPTGLTKNDLLNRLESLCRFAVRHQRADGAFIDPILDREFQYATPYLAYALATLVDEGRAPELVNAAALATGHAVEQVAMGNAGIPDQHGEFFLAPLVDAVAMLEDLVHEDQYYIWSDALSVRIDHVIESRAAKTNNWRTYAMKGDWWRVRQGWIPREQAVDFVEDAWLHRTQAERVLPTRDYLYRDWNGDPQSLAVEAVGRGNLLALVSGGYDGPSANAIRQAVHHATQTSLLLQAPDGQAPPNGRTDNHVFNDVLYGLIFATMANDLRESDPALAGQYKRAAALALNSIERWKRTDAPWAGAYSITKNFYPPEDRVGYQPASQVSNYTGAVLYHLAEAVHVWHDGIEERPAPTELGGYALTLDADFGAAVLNAGGMQVFINLRGDSVPKYGDYWTPLGIVRVSRAGWDGRLGPSDGARTANGSVAHVPEWRLRGQWVRLPEMAEHYRGTMIPLVVEPSLVRARVLYAPVTGVGGPSFAYDLTVTPNLVHVRLSSPNDAEFRAIVPILTNDGHPLEIGERESILTVRYPDGADEQTLIALNTVARFEATGDAVRSTYGDLQPYRLEAGEGGAIEYLIYPRSTDDPPAEAVRDSFVTGTDGFETVFGDVKTVL